MRPLPVRSQGALQLGLMQLGSVGVQLQRGTSVERIAPRNEHLESSLQTLGARSEHDQEEPARAPGLMGRMGAGRSSSG